MTRARCRVGHAWAVSVTVLLVLQVAATAQAATIYVDSGVSGTSCATYNPSSRNCTGGSATGYKTMNAAASAAVPGTTVLVRGGSYTSQFAPAVSGTAGSPITFRNYTGETV